MINNTKINTEERYGFIGIVVQDFEKSGREIQTVLSKYSNIIFGRMGLPHLDNTNNSVITLIVKTDSDNLGGLTGKLGKIPGVSVKSGLCKID